MNIMSCRLTIFEQTVAAFKATRVLLLRLIDGSIVPLEQGYGGDPELFPFVPLLVDWFHLSLDQAIWWAYAVITSLGIVLAITGFLRLCTDWISRAVAVAGVLGVGMVCYSIYDIYLLSFFALCFAPCLCALFSEKKFISLALYCAVAGSIMVSINFLRLHTATALGLMVVSAVVLYYKFSRRTVALLVCFGLGVAMASFGIKKALETRNNYLDAYGIAYGDHALGHVFWLSIYVGCGFITNDLEISFSDTCGYRKVKEIDPTVPFCSVGAEKIMKKEMINLCRSHPFFILKMLFAKAGVLFYYLLMFANVGLLCAWFYRKPWYLEIPYWLAIWFSALPGMVTVPVAPYLTGFFTAATFYGIHSIIWALQHGLYTKIKLFFRRLFL